MKDVEKDIYELLAKLQGRGELEKLHSYANDVIGMFLDNAKEKGTHGIDMDELCRIMEENAVEYNFYRNLSIYERELIGAMILGCLE